MNLDVYSQFFLILLCGTAIINVIFSYYTDLFFKKNVKKWLTNAYQFVKIKTIKVKQITKGDKDEKNSYKKNR